MDNEIEESLLPEVRKGYQIKMKQRLIDQRLDPN